MCLCTASSVFLHLSYSGLVWYGILNTLRKTGSAEAGSILKYPASCLAKSQPKVSYSQLSLPYTALQYLASSLQ